MSRTKFAIGDWVELSHTWPPARISNLKGCLGRVQHIRATSPRYEIIWYPPINHRQTWDYHARQGFWSVEYPSMLQPAGEILADPAFFYAIMTECLAPGLERVPSLSALPTDGGLTRPLNVKYLKGTEFGT